MKESGRAARRKKMKVLLLAIDYGFYERRPPDTPELVPSVSPYQRHLFHLLRNFVLADPLLRRSTEFRVLSFRAPPEARARFAQHSGGVTTLPPTEWHYQAALKAAEGSPDLVGLSAYMWSVRDLLIVAQYLRQISPSTRVLLGGPEAYGEDNARSLLAENPCLDFAAFGEGELTLRELLRQLGKGGPDFASVPFLAYRSGGRSRLSRSRELLPDLDEIPSPVLSQTRRELSAHPLAVVSTSRGCPVGCAYCVYSVGLATDGNRVRFHSAERVLSELAHLRRHGVRRIFFPDSNFAANPAVAVPVLNYFLDTYRNASVEFEQKLELIPDQVMELISRLQRQGRLSFDAGIQTINPKALKEASRVQSMSLFLEKMRKLDLARVSPKGICVDLMLGLPGDTYAGFLKSLDFIHNDLFGKLCAPAGYYVASLAVLKGTKYHGRAAELGLHFEPVPPYLVMKTRSMSFEELRMARILVELLEVLAPAIRFLRLRGVALPCLFGKSFDKRRFFGLNKRGLYDQRANLFHGCAAFRRYLSGRKIDADLKSFALELLDYCYLKHPAIRAGCPAELLRLPSLVYSPRAKARGAPAWPERFWMAHHFRFRYGAHIFQTEGETSLRPVPKTAYAMAGHGQLGLLPERAYRFLMRESRRFAPSGLRTAMRESAVYRGSPEKALSVDHDLLLRAIAFPCAW